MLQDSFFFHASSLTDLVREYSIFCHFYCMHVCITQAFPSTCVHTLNFSPLEVPSHVSCLYTYTGHLRNHSHGAFHLHRTENLSCVVISLLLHLYLLKCCLDHLLLALTKKQSFSPSSDFQQVICPT